MVLLDLEPSGYALVKIRDIPIIIVGLTTRASERDYYRFT